MIKNISIIGGGNLAQCFVDRIIACKQNHKVSIFDIDKKKNKYSTKRNIKFFSSIDRNLSESQLILLAIKPNDFKLVSEDIIEYGNKKSIVLSLMAGSKLNIIDKSLNKSFYTARIMTNINAQFGNAQSFIFTRVSFPKNRLDSVINFLNLFGATTKVNTEIQIDKLTALCGSGPAYFLYFTQIVKDTFKKFGFKDHEAEKLSRHLFYSTGYTCYHNKNNMEDIKKTIVSKKGTTEAALNRMEEKNIRKIIMESIDQAYKKSIQLGKRNND